MREKREKETGLLPLLALSLNVRRRKEEKKVKEKVRTSSEITPVIMHLLTSCRPQKRYLGKKRRKGKKERKTASHPLSSSNLYGILTVYMSLGREKREEDLWRGEKKKGEEMRRPTLRPFPVREKGRGNTVSLICCFYYELKVPLTDAQGT